MMTHVFVAELLEQSADGKAVMTKVLGAFETHEAGIKAAEKWESEHGTANHTKVIRVLSVPFGTLLGPEHG